MNWRNTDCARIIPWYPSKTFKNRTFSPFSCLFQDMATVFSNSIHTQKNKCPFDEKVLSFLDLYLTTSNPSRRIPRKELNGYTSFLAPLLHPFIYYSSRNGA